MMKARRYLRAVIHGVVLHLLTSAVVFVAGAADERQRLANAFPVRFAHQGGGLLVDVVESADGCRPDGTTTVTGTVKIEHRNGTDLLLEGIASGETRCGGDASASEDAGDDGAPRVEIFLVTPAPRKRSIVGGLQVQKPEVRLVAYASRTSSTTTRGSTTTETPEYAWVLRASGKVSTRSDADDGGADSANEDVVFGEAVISTDVTYSGDDGVFGAQISRISANLRVRLGDADGAQPVSSSTTTTTTTGVTLRAHVDYAQPCASSDAVKASDVEAELSLSSASGALTLPAGEATFFCGSSDERTAVVGEKSFQVAARYDARRNGGGGSDDAMTLSLGRNGRQAVESVELSVIAYVGDTSARSEVKTLHAVDESAVANASAVDLEKMRAASDTPSATTTTPGGDAVKDPEHGWLPFPGVAGLEISGTIVFVLVALDEASPGLGLAWIAEAYFDRPAGDVAAPLELAYVDPPSNGDAHARGALVDLESNGVVAHLVSGDVDDGCMGGGASAQGVLRIDAPATIRASFAVFGTRSCDSAGDGNWNLVARAVANITVLGGRA